MKKGIILILTLIGSMAVLAQTGPTPIALPVNYTLDDLDAASTTYPAGMKGWSVSNQANKSAAEGSSPTADLALVIATPSSTGGGIYNWGKMIGPLATGSLSPQVVMAINTTGKTNIAVSYSVVKAKENARSNGLTLQYRVGDSGTWTTVGNSDYVSGSSAVGDATHFSNLLLGANANNQSLVQLRWIYYEVSGSGSRDGLGIKNIKIDEATADGTGSATISVSKWFTQDSKDVTFVFKKAADPLSQFKLIVPSYFTWSKTNSDVETATSFTLGGDTVTFSPDFSSVDSFVVRLKNLTLSTDTTLMASWPVYTTHSGTFKVINNLPKTLLIGSPKTLIEARGNDANGVVLNLGKYITVRGIVTVANEYGGPSVIQDATAGLSIYSPNVSSNITIGDEIVVVGSIGQFNGLTELLDATLIETISTGNNVEPLTVTIAQVLADGVGGVENYESQLVKIKNVTVATATWTSGASGTNYPLTDATGTMDIRVDNNVNFAGDPAPGSAFDVVGVLSQYVAASPFKGGYQLLPRSKADIISSGASFATNPVETDMTPSSITLSWTTSANATPGLKYGLTTALELGKVTGTQAGKNHNVTISDLSAASVYYVKPFAFIGNDTAFAATMPVVSKSLSSGKIDVYFNKSIDSRQAEEEIAHGNIAFSDTLVALIGRAKSSISVALYSLSGTVGAKVGNALISARNRGVVVRVIMEDDNSNTAPPNNLKNNGIPFITDKYGLNSGDGLMHNKFLVFDANSNNPNDAYVWMGSYNTTDTGENNDYQNVVLIQDQSLAKIYTMEFNEMWGSSSDVPNSTTSRFGANKTNNTPHRLLIGNTWVESYFSPSDQVTEQIKKAILSTDYQAYISLLTFTKADLAIAEQTKAAEGKKFINILDNNSDQGTQFTFLGTFSEAYIHNIGGLYHHKYLIVDNNQAQSDPLVLTGSHNWSSSAETKNNENTLIFHSYRIANLYVQEFAARYAEVGGTYNLPLEVKTNPLADSFELLGNYPNPFNPSTTLRFTIPNTGHVTVEVVNVLGQKIATLVNGQLDKGYHDVPFNAASLASGVYFYTVQFNQTTKTAKFILSK